MNLKEIKALTKEDMAALNVIIIDQMHSDIPLVNQLSAYIINGGGKRIRPMISILSARALNYKGDQHIIVAALIEFIHTATLLHDDVVDKSDLRRGKKTANTVFGNSASVLVGDFIYTRAFQMMTDLGSMRILKVMSSATNVISEGEVQQLMYCNNVNITEYDYMKVIYSKTARLFEAASQSAAILAKASPEQESALQSYGCYLGTTYQLIDDLLDYNSKGNLFGKDIGDDLDEGKATLPLLHAMHHGTEEQKQMISFAIKRGNARQSLPQILNIMKQCGSLGYTLNRAKEEANKAISALQILPKNSYRTALESLAYFAVKRSF